MAAASTYLGRSNMESTHIYGLLFTPWKKGAESAELTSIYGLEQRAENRADFDRVKKVFLHYHWEIWTKVCYRLFIKTIKNHINLCKMGIWWHL